MSCWTYSHRVIVRHLDVLLKKGENLLIMGPSGVGKSTFLLALMDLYEYYEGDIEFQPPDRVMMLPQVSQPVKSNTRRHLNGDVCSVLLLPPDEH